VTTLATTTTPLIHNNRMVPSIMINNMIIDTLIRAEIEIEAETEIVIDADIMMMMSMIENEGSIDIETEMEIV
jgi:hypothetical protein